MPAVSNPCAGERVMAKVEADFLPTITGQLDRKVTITRDCGHTYFWGGAVTGLLPDIGDRAMQCLGPPDATFNRPPEQVDAPVYFDPRKRSPKRRGPRKGEAA